LLLVQTHKQTHNPATIDFHGSKNTSSGGQNQHGASYDQLQPYIIADLFNGSTLSPKTAGKNMQKSAAAMPPLDTKMKALDILFKIVS